MLPINVKYRVAKKASYYSIDLMLISQKYHVISRSSNKIVSSANQNNIDFLKNGRLNSHKNASNQRKVQSCKENRYYSIELQSIFQKRIVICNDCK